MGLLYTICLKNNKNKLEQNIKQKQRKAKKDACGCMRLLKPEKYYSNLL